jgi:hypothetical protein
MTYRSKELVVTFTIASILSALHVTSANAQAAARKTAGAVNSEITLDVSGGPNAGHYVAKATQGGCSDMSNKWGNQYSIDTKDAKQFSSLQLIVPNAKDAANGTSAFTMTVGFGPLFFGNGKQYNVDANTKSGEGTVKIDDRGSSATVTFDAKTAAGVGLKGTIECHSLMRM